MLKNGKIPKKAVVIGAVVLVAVVAVAVILLMNANAGGELSGTWVHERSHSQYETSIRFYRNRFVATRWTAADAAGGGAMWVGTSQVPWRFSIRCEQMEVVAVSDSRALAVVGDNLVRGAHKIIVRGTYSTTDDRIELVSDNGVVQVFDFRRTENTLDIGGHRFIRR